MKVAQEFVDSTLNEIPDVEAMTGKVSNTLIVATDQPAWVLALGITRARDNAEWAEEQDFLDYLLDNEPAIEKNGPEYVYYWPDVQVTED